MLQAGDAAANAKHLRPPNYQILN